MRRDVGGCAATEFKTTLVGGNHAIFFSLLASRFSVCALTLLSSSPAAYAADPAVSCETGKLKASGKYASCLLSADAKAVSTGNPPDYSKCDEKLDKSWATAETKGMGMCPAGTGDQADVQDFLDYCGLSVADALENGGITNCPDDLVTCEGDLVTCGDDLTTCGANLGDCQALVGPLKTGQTTCYDSAGAVIACAGTGQDGEIQAGVARSFTDNGDGTITDDATGLMWEKLGDDGSIHDLDNNYTWANAFAVKIATLNSTVFAGYDDWRLPNVAELATLVDYTANAPAIHPEFDDACTGGCTVTTCSCTRPGSSSAYWSSTTNESAPTRAWRLDFSDGTTNFVDVTKTATRPVRAVRGGVSAPVCGNAIAEVGEECDGIDLNGASCSSLGFDLSGTLACSVGCEYDTTDCANSPADLPASGQTTSYGAGDDGATQAGGVLAYVDNGDGTISDTNTGLMWEKKVSLNNSGVDCTDETGSCANPHDADNYYSWSVSSPTYNGRVVTIFLEQLNNRCDQDTTVSCTVDADCMVPGGACGFAGYQDWRLPNFKELHSIVDAERFNPAVDPAFDGVSCGPACTDITDPACSCTKSAYYWSSTTYAGAPTDAWLFYFGVGDTLPNNKTGANYVRAVRGGS